MKDEELAESHRSLFAGVWAIVHPNTTPDHLGLIPFFFDARDERPAKEQINERYCAGPWSPLKGCTLNPDTLAMDFPGDPPLPMLAAMYLPKTKEMVAVFEHAFVGIIPDGKPEEAEFDRLD